jgi:hypothetical protein
MKNACNPNHSAHIVVLSGVEKHPNADKLQKARAFGAGIIVGLDAKNGDIGVYFQSGLAIDYDFAKVNDLLRRKDPATGLPLGGMLEETGRIKTQKLRGETSDGLFLPLSSLSDAGVTLTEIENLQPGDFFEELDGIKICTKYVPRGNKNGGGAAGTKMKKMKGSIMFKEHYDTSQLRFNLHRFSPDDFIVVTEKLHGTSQRVGFVQKVTELTGLSRFIAKLLRHETKTYEWDEMIGTRKTVLNTDNNSGFYSTDFRFEAAMPFFDKLQKGETVYYEVVGYADEKPIMGTVDNEKLGPEFVAKYGKKTTFSYSCKPGEFDIFVYRITINNEDGYAMDYTWDAIEKRCGELGIKHVPVLYKGSIIGFVNNTPRPEVPISLGAMVEKAADAYVQGPSTIMANFDPAPCHIREGIVIRIEGTSCPTTFKHKSFEFKVLEGIIKPETAGVDNAEEL